MRRVLVALCLVSIVSPCLAKLQIRQDDRVDFGSYRTYALAKGTPAAYPQVQQWIEQAVSRELEAKGLTRAAPDEADLRVKTYAFGQTEVAAGLQYIYVPSWNAGYLRFNIDDINTGTLIVDIYDRATDQPVWRAMATKSVSRDVNKALGKIDTMTRKMFKSFPSR